jgi:hypothetical protein
MIAVSCRPCGRKRQVPDDQVCLGVRCDRCDRFMEAERVSTLDDLDWQFSGRRRARQLTPLAKVWLLLMLMTSLTAAPLLYLTGTLEAAAESNAALRGVLLTLAVSLLNVAFVSAVFYLKKWGAYALLGIAVGGGILAVLVGMWPVALLEVVAVGLLFAALKAGDPDSWSQMR